MASTTTSATTISVVIYGPNLNDQRKGQFHVHAAGCADGKHYGPGTKHGGDEGWTIEADSFEAIADELYSDFIAEGSMEPGTLDDIHFAPCVKFPKAPKAVEQGEQEPPNGRVLVDRRNKRTGHRVVLIDAETSDDFQSEEGGRWVLFCCGHGLFVQVDGQRPARDLHPAPWEWCAECQADQGLHPHEFVPPPAVQRVVRPERQDVTEKTVSVVYRPDGYRVILRVPGQPNSTLRDSIETHGEALTRARVWTEMCGYVLDACEPVEEES